MQRHGRDVDDDPEQHEHDVDDVADVDDDPDSHGDEHVVPAAMLVSVSVMYMMTGHNLSMMLMAVQARIDTNMSTMMSSVSVTYTMTMSPCGMSMM